MICSALKPDLIWAAINANTFCSDCNGDQWQVERKAEKARFSKNRQVIDKGEEAFLEAMTDGDQEHPLYDVFKVDYLGTNIFAKRDQKVSPYLSRFQSLGQEKIDGLIGECLTFLKLDKNVGLPNLVSFSRKAKPVYEKWQATRHHLKVLNETYGALKDVDPHYLDALEQEVEVLRKLERNSGFISDPAQSYDVLRGKLKKLDSQLKSTCDKHSIHQLPMLEYNINWDEVIATLSKLQALERLEQGYQGSLNHVNQMIKPIFQDHLRSMRGFLSDDKKLLGDIESALQNLTMQCQKMDLASQTDSKNDKNFFKKIFAEKTEPTPSESADPQILDSSRSAVDHVLRGLGAMCSNLELASANYTEGLDSIQSRYEKIVKELGKEKEKWQKLAQKYHLDANTSLKSMLSLINNLGQISILYAKKKDVQESLTHYRKRLKTLEGIVMEWRVQTGSQKASDLSQPAILISEAKNMLQYQSKKELQLKKTKKLRHKVDFFRKLQGDYSKTIESCLTKWADAFNLIGSKQLQIEKLNWPQLFDSISRSQVCGELIQVDSNHLSGDDLFKLDNLNSPLNLFEMNISNVEGRESFLEKMESLSPHCNLLIILDDFELARSLSELGVGSSTAIRPRKSGDNRKSSAKNKTVVAPGMSEKARAALDLFKGRDGDLPG